jgi:hypothetical protein
MVPTPDHQPLPQSQKQGPIIHINAATSSAFQSKKSKSKSPDKVFTTNASQHYSLNSKQNPYKVVIDYSHNNAEK